MIRAMTFLALAHTTGCVQYGLQARQTDPKAGSDAEGELLQEEVEDPQTRDQDEEVEDPALEEEQEEPTEHVVTVIVSADDAYEVSVDGVHLGGDTTQSWHGYGIYEAIVPEGEVVVAVHAWDIYMGVNGAVVIVAVDDVVVSVTGDPGWLATSQGDYDGWDVDLAPPPVGWDAPQACGALWGEKPIDELAAENEARWVWAESCSSLDDMWLRTDIDVPGVPRTRGAGGDDTSTGDGTGDDAPGA